MDGQAVKGLSRAARQGRGRREDLEVPKAAYVRTRCMRRRQVRFDEARVMVRVKRGSVGRSV
jgi:hypothetical protein